MVPVFLSLLLPLVGCSPEPPALTVGEVAFSQQDLLTFNADRRTSLAGMTAFGLATARGELAALGEGVVQRRIREAVLEALEREVILEGRGVGEDELRERYRSNPEYELSVRHLVLLVEEWEGEEEETEAREAAQAALERIRRGEDFAAVAGQVSEEPGAAEGGGLLQPGRRGSWVGPFWEAASSLEVGEVSPVIRTEYGFHVLKLEGRAPLPFSQARWHFVRELAGAFPIPTADNRSWADSVAGALTLDTTLVADRFREAGALFLFARSCVREEAAGPVVARWEGGEFTLEELGRFLLSLDRAEWNYVREGGPEELLRVATDAARRILLEGIARERMGDPPPDVVRQIRNDWLASASGWARALGFEEGMTPDQVKAAALAGATTSAQGGTLARRSLQNWAPLLLAAFPIGPEE